MNFACAYRSTKTVASGSDGYAVHPYSPDPQDQLTGNFHPVQHDVHVMLLVGCASESHHLTSASWCAVVINYLSHRYSQHDCIVM